jgi:hypothetical protein
MDKKGSEIESHGLREKVNIPGSSGDIDGGVGELYQGRSVFVTSSASQKAIVRLLDLTRLNELCLRSTFN